MAHVRKEGRLCLAGLFRRVQCFAQGLVLGHGIPHFGIDDGKPHSYRMYHVVLAVFRVMHPSHADHFVVFLAVPAGQVAVGDQLFVLERLADVRGLDELQESFAVFFRNAVVAVVPEPFQVGEMHSFGVLLVVFGVAAVTDGVILVEVHVIDAAVVRGHGGNHAVQLRPLFLAFQQLLFNLFVLFGNVRNKHVVEPAVVFAVGVVSVIIYPTELSVFALDAVLDIVQFFA